MTIHIIGSSDINEMITVTVSNFVSGILHSDSPEWKEAITENQKRTIRVTVSHIQQLLTIRIADLRSRSVAPLAYIQYNVPRKTFYETVVAGEIIVPHMERLLFALGLTEGSSC